MEREKKQNSVKLLDCTLGSGGELINWRFGEQNIRNMLPLLQRGGIDIVEYGIMCSYTAGLDRTVFDSTVLPPFFARRRGQQYSVFLDKYSRPLLSEIPRRGENTTDIVRIRVCRSGLESQLAYCAALMEKGYAVAVLVEEAGQYDADALSALLRKIDALHPWGCYIYDDSGVLDANRLREVFTIYDQELSDDTMIGFQGRDSLFCGTELAQMFAQFETKRALCVDVSANGIGSGAMHLASEPYARWMNETFGTQYDIPVLAYQTVFTQQYVEAMHDVGTKLLYCVAARNKCSYRYVEYFRNLQIEPSVQLEIIPEISRDAAFCFEKTEADDAIFRSRKKKLNLAIVVLTANHPERIQKLLCTAQTDLVRYGVDIFIYDDSKDDRTYAVVQSHRLNGYKHIFYKKYAEKLTYNEKVICAYREHLDYDYTWLLRDDIIPTIPGLYNELRTYTDSGMEFIVVDAAFRNQFRRRMKRYDDYLEMFAENSNRLPLLGTCIIKNALMKQILEHQPSACCQGDFWMPAALLRELPVAEAKTGLIIADAFFYDQSHFAESFLNNRTLQIWAQDWYASVKELPEAYDGLKASAVRVDIVDVHPFRLKSMLYLRASGCFSLSVYRHWKSRLTLVSNKAGWKFCFAALVPRFLAKQLARFAGCQGSSRMGKLADTLRKIACLGE